jgi:hypothetical protein
LLQGKICKRGDTGLEDLLLTQEEIDRRNELFAYEMTQIAIDFKEHRSKRSKSPSPIERSGLTEKDLNLQLDYTPLHDVEITKKPLEIPSVSANAEFSPPADIKITIAYETDVNTIMQNDDAEIFKPLADIAINTKIIGVPKSDFTINYKKANTVDLKAEPVEVPANASFTTKFIPAEADSIAAVPMVIPASGLSLEYESFVPEADSIAAVPIAIPTSGFSFEYESFVPEVVDTGTQDIPEVLSIAKYTPMHIESVEKMHTPYIIPDAVNYSYTPQPLMPLEIPLIQVVANEKTGVTYTPVSVEPIKLSIESVPQTPEVSSFAPAVIEVDISITDSLPEAKSDFKYKPKKAGVKARKQKLPTVSEITELKPVDLTVATGAQATIPVVNTDFKYKKPRKRKAALKKIEAPVFAGVQEYKLPDEVVPERTVFSVPKPVLDFAPEDLKITPSAKISKIPYPTQQYNKKDYYAIWEAM